MAQQEQIINQLIERGLEVFDIEDVRTLFPKMGSELNKTMKRLTDKGWIVPIYRGLYFLGPIFLQAPPNEYQILTKIIGDTPYYVTYYTTLRRYALIQQPINRLYVATLAKSRAIELPAQIGMNILLVKVKERKLFGFKKEWINPKFPKIPFADVHKTIVDCLEMPKYCGGVQEVYKLVGKRYKELNYKILQNYLEKQNNDAARRRAAFLVSLAGEMIGESRAAEAFVKRNQKIKTNNYVRLDPNHPFRKGDYHKPLGLNINVDLSAFKL